MEDKKNHFSLTLQQENSPNFLSNLSPMTDLAYNLGTLTTLTQETPKRRFSFSSVDMLTPVLEKSQDCNVGLVRPDVLVPSAEFVENRFLTDISNESNKAFRSRTRKFGIIPKSSLIKYDNTYHSPSKENIPDAQSDSLLPLDIDDDDDNETKNSTEKKDQLLPDDFQLLLKRPLVPMEDFESDSLMQTSTTKSCIRGLFRQKSEDVPHKPSGKRLEFSPCETPKFHISKRRKATSFSCQTAPETQLVPVKLQRSYSETEKNTIMKAVQISSENPGLIGDCSRLYSLPWTISKHGDLKSISAETLERLLQGDFTSTVRSHIIVDCRFPYEFEAGHIQGARNIYSRDDLIQEFFKDSILNSSTNDVIVIFHCEFSSERGPSLSRFMRSKDREVNDDRYPSLYYPEVYLLSGGYKAFFENCKYLCEPQAYKPMTHKDHEEDLKLFRAKAKSWHGEQKCKITHRPGLKF